MTTSLRFDNRVVVITGAGVGLGRAYALEFAKRGAKIVVNDIDRSAADHVAEQIGSIKGISTSAVADYHSVSEGDKIVATAISTFGRIDVLVNNAGILRDVSFGKMTINDWNVLYEVHLKGTFISTHAAWKHMVAQKYGRIITVTSIAGICGNFGQANYSAMKSAMIGFTKTLAKEGARHNIKVNCLAPLAASRMTDTLLLDEIKPLIAAEHVAPVVSVLAHETCTDSGEIVEVAGGWVSKVRFQRGRGTFMQPPFSAEQLVENWSKVGDYSEPDYPQAITDTITVVMSKAKLYYLFFTESTCKQLSLVRTRPPFVEASIFTGEDRFA